MTMSVGDQKCSLRRITEDWVDYDCSGTEGHTIKLQADSN
jgi:hypothetical protein